MLGQHRDRSRADHCSYTKGCLRRADPTDRGPHPRLATQRELNVRGWSIGSSPSTGPSWCPVRRSSPTPAMARATTGVTASICERPQLTQRGRATRLAQHRRRACCGRPAGPQPPRRVTADVEIPTGGAEGVLLCQGANNGGFTLYVRDQRLRYAHNYLSRAIYQVASPDPLPDGKHRLRLRVRAPGEPDFTNRKGAPGRAQLYVDDDLVAQADLPMTVPIAFNPGALSCGANPGSPITALVLVILPQARCPAAPGAPVMGRWRTVEDGFEVPLSEATAVAGNTSTEQSEGDDVGGRRRSDNGFAVLQARGVSVTLCGWSPGGAHPPFAMSSSRIHQWRWIDRRRPRPGPSSD